MLNAALYMPRLLVERLTVIESPVQDLHTGLPRLPIYWTEAGFIKPEQILLPVSEQQKVDKWLHRNYENTINAWTWGFDAMLLMRAPGRLEIE